MKNPVPTTDKKAYLLSVGILLLLSFYPLVMGVRILVAHVRDGYIDVADYPKYVIPYTPIAMALILSAVLLPPVIQKCKRFTLAFISVFGVGAFLLFEILFEQVIVFDGDGTSDIGSWQALLCYVTPEAMRAQASVGEILARRYSPIFKVHFYLISVLIVISVIGVIYSFIKMVREKDFGKKKPLIAHAVSVGAFICLCIWACFTSFYRTGTLELSTLSSWLMSVFFILFGVTAGTYSGSLLYFKRPRFSRLLPACVAAVTTLVMYIGELILMGGVLFTYGSGFLFDSIGTCPLAPIDFFIIALSGGITYLILFWIRQREKLV